MNKITPNLILRSTYIIIFLWFGYQQLVTAGMWVGYLPSWSGYFPIPGEMLVQLNGFAEIIAACFLIFNVYPRLIAGLLGLHLLMIAWTAGSAIGMRDFGLAMIGAALALNKSSQTSNVDFKI